MAKKPVMLIILDGWGIREMEEGNAVKLAHTPNYDFWMSNRERSVLDASEEAVGLVAGQMGNSEVGHLNLGAGRVVYQDISRIDVAIRENELQSHPEMLKAFDLVRQTGKKLHIFGLLSDGGVHSHERHLYALLQMCQTAQVKPVLHIITDGRDTPTNSGYGFVEKLENYVSETHSATIASLSGRYYAMDRDNRWERTQLAFDAMAHHQADSVAQTALEALKRSYEAGVTDEFIKPTVIGDSEGKTVQAGDVLVFFNFRSDRMRQLVQVFAYEQVAGFNGVGVPGTHIITFTSYDDTYPVTVLFGKDPLKNVLAEVISRAGLSQYHSAETEKYPHVTFFFNGGREEPFPGESRQIVPSPKVATYDLKPEMSAYELTEMTLSRLKNHDDAFLLINFANPDMVGHTGSLDAAMKAVAVVDECAKRLVDAVVAKGGVAIVTADHGNCERMVELSTGQSHTYHTTNPVSFFVIGEGYYAMRSRGKLADVAPTVLDLLELEKPAEMTGESLIFAYRA